MQDLIPSSDLWWRYFIYGALFHVLAATPLVKTDRQAEIIRFAGYATGVIPVFMHEGIIAAGWMVAFLFGFSFALKYFTSMFKK